ncbi:hypothetical protein C8Q79DRAFT_1116163 [Trametes meyenii]|nr:hypothetical protein C8Q79DRAFT_1116163 [Trametes meyenii]
MFFTVIVYFCAFAFAGVFQGLADDTLLPFLASALNIPTLSAFNLNTIFSLAGPAPRPTLPLPDLPIDQPTINTTDIYPFLTLEAPVPVSFFARGSSVWYQFLGRSSGLFATVLAAFLFLVSWYIYTTIFEQKPSQYLLPSSSSNKSTVSYDLNNILYPHTLSEPVQHIILPSTATQTISVPVSTYLPTPESEASDDISISTAPTSDIYEQLFGSSSGEPVFEPITSPTDMVQQLNDIIVSNAKGGAVVDCGDGQYPILAMFDSDEMYYVGADWLEGYDDEGVVEEWNEDHG